MRQQEREAIYSFLNKVSENKLEKPVEGRFLPSTKESPPKKQEDVLGKRSVRPDDRREEGEVSPYKRQKTGEVASKPAQEVKSDSRERDRAGNRDDYKHYNKDKKNKKKRDRSHRRDRDYRDNYRDHRDRDRDQRDYRRSPKGAEQTESKS